MISVKIFWIKVAMLISVGSSLAFLIWLDENQGKNAYRAALIQADKNYRAALREDTELNNCREALEMIVVMEAL